jgi:predicted ATPase
LITGANASGKSNLYKSLRLLAETAKGGVVNALAKEGGLESTFWAGPKEITREMRLGNVNVEGTAPQGVKRLKLGFATEDLSYAISLGLPPQQPPSAFNLDPEIKTEAIWSGEVFRPAASLVERREPAIKNREGRSWQVIEQHAPTYESIFNLVADPTQTPEVIELKNTILSWRFYDHFRTDPLAPARQPQLGTRTPVLSHDGHDLAAALQTIIEVGDEEGLHSAIDDAFPGSRLRIELGESGLFLVKLHQHGLLRELKAGELSDGTLRYLCLVAALLTPRPPTMMVLNEPETSLHPSLLPALARLIIKASHQTQVWVVSHADGLIDELEQYEGTNCINLEKNFGQTEIKGLGMFDVPSWKWPDTKG